MLVEGGADVNQQNHRGDTPLHYACRAGHVDAVAALIDLKVELNHRGAHGATALLLAMVHHQYEVVKLLVMAGADHRIADDEGMRPFNDTSLEEVLAWLRLPPLEELREVKLGWMRAADSATARRGRGSANSSPRRIERAGGDGGLRATASTASTPTSVRSAARGSKSSADGATAQVRGGATAAPQSNGGGGKASATATGSPTLHTKSPRRGGTHQSPLSGSAAAGNALRGLRRQQSAYRRRGATPQ